MSSSVPPAVPSISVRSKKGERLVSACMVPTVKHRGGRGGDVGCFAGDTVVGCCNRWPSQDGLGWGGPQSESESKRINKCSASVATSSKLFEKPFQVTTSWSSIERLPRVWKAIIKAKGGYFEEYKLFHFFFYDIISYMFIHSLMTFLRIYNVNRNENKEKTLNEKVCPNFWLVVYTLEYITQTNLSAHTPQPKKQHMHKTGSGATTECCCFNGSDLLLLRPVWKSWAAASTAASSHWMNPVPWQQVTWSSGLWATACLPALMSGRLSIIHLSGSSSGAHPIQCKSVSCSERCHTPSLSLGQRGQTHAHGRKQKIRPTTPHYFLYRRSIDAGLFLLYFLPLFE